MQPKIVICKKMCKECAFNGNTENTLYAETFDIIDKNKVFPCHTYLKQKTGSENLGVETLDTVRVCRGYVAFMQKNNLINPDNPFLAQIWKELVSELEVEDLNDILTLEELIEAHDGLKNNIKLGN